MTTDPHPWALALDSLHAQVWTLLGRGVADRHAAARLPTLATTSPAGWPEARTVVLRAADAEAATLDIHTDVASAKVADLRHNPSATLHIWDPAAHLQTRIKATVTLLTGEAVAAIWAKVPDPARQSYGTRPSPGQPIASGLAYDKAPDLSTFAVLRCSVQVLDVLHLGPQHRRARFERADGWMGQWLSP